MSIEACILSCLIRKPGHGYELQGLLRRYSDVHPMTNVNVYPLLRALETKGCVSSRTEVTHSRARKVYEITDRGRAEFEQWLDSPVEDLTTRISDPVMLRILLMTDLDRSFAWLREAIHDAQARRDQAAAQFAGRTCDTPPIVQFAIEEQIASFDHRFEFLKRVAAAIEEEAAARQGSA